MSLKIFKDFVPIRPKGNTRDNYVTLWNAQRGLCCYCETVMIHKPSRGGPALIDGKHQHLNCATVEHLNRTYDGGTNVPDNLALACYDCNRGRGLMDWLTYKSYRMGECLVSIMD